MTRPGSAVWQRRLPSGRRRRRPRGRCQQAKRSPLGDYRPLDRRPARINNRDEPGHWEGGLVIGAGNDSAAAALAERASRHALVVPLPDGYGAHATATALARQPSHLVKTPTRGQGREMAHWADIETALGIEVFFCDPRSPWQRPTNEQTNGLLRRWLPKGSNLNLNPVHLAVIADNLNWMPRKLHNWKPAADIYTQLCRNHH